MRKREEESCISSSFFMAKHLLFYKNSCKMNLKVVESGIKWCEVGVNSIFQKKD